MKMIFKNLEKVILFFFIIFDFIFTQISLPNSNITLKQINETTFQINYKLPRNSWAGLGFGENMKKADINYVQVFPNGSFSLHDTFSESYSIPKDDTSKGGSFDFKNIQSFEDKDGYLNITFERLFNTSDIYDEIVIPDVNTPVIVAWGDGDITYHKSNKTRKLINITYISDGTNDNKIETFWALHGLGQTFTWSFLSFVGYISARFYKHVKFWIFFHFMGAAFPIIYSFCFIIPVIVENGVSINSEMSIWNKIHVILGSIFFFLIIIQLFLGIFSFYIFYVKSNVKNQKIFLLKRVHFVIGAFLTISSYLMMFSGFNILLKNYNFIPLILLLFPLFIIYLEIKTLKNNMQKIKLYDDFILESFRSKHLKKYNLKELKSLQKKNNNLKFVLYENFIIDVTEFFSRHPGGKNLIIENLFSDIGRYVTGTQSYSTTINSHAHGLETLKYLVDHTLGIYKEGQIFCQKINKSELPFKGKYQEYEIENLLDKNNIYESNLDYFSDYFTFLEKKNIANDTYQIIFHNKNILFEKILPGINWIGKHISVNSNKLNKIRYYSICLSLDSFVKEKLYLLEKNLNNLENGKNYESNKNIKLFPNITQSNNFSIFVKKYNFKNCLSKEINELKENDQILLKGPMGLGLKLNKNLKGTHIAICGGTGLIPVLDLFSLIHRYTIDKISREKFNNYDNNIFDEKFDFINPDFKLIIFASFKSKDNTIFDDLMENLDRITKKYVIDVFSYFLNTDNKKSWDGEMIKDTIKANVNLKKIYFSGPIGFMENYKKLILDLNLINEDKILFI